MFALLAYFFATTAVAALVAQRVLAGSGQNDNLMLATTLRVIGTTIVLRIPVLGPLVVIAMILFGTGTGTGTGTGALAIVEWCQARKLAGAPTPAGTPMADGAGGGTVTPPVTPAAEEPPAEK